MPIITVKLAKGRNIEQKRRFVSAVTASAVETLNVNSEWVTVLFEAFDRNNWSTGGEFHSDKFGSGCGTEGTVK